MTSPKESDSVDDNDDSRDNPYASSRTAYYALGFDPYLYNQFY